MGRAGAGSGGHGGGSHGSHSVSHHSSGGHRVGSSSSHSRAGSGLGSSSISRSSIGHSSVNLYSKHTGPSVSAHIDIPISKPKSKPQYEEPRRQTPPPVMPRVDVHVNTGSSYRRTYSPPPPPPRQRVDVHVHDDSYRRNTVTTTTVPESTSSISLLIAFVAVFVFMIIFMVLVSSIGKNSGGASTIVREKIGSPQSWVNDCVTDELGWFDNESKAEKSLRSFYDETGVQPYILLRKYDPELTTDYDKEMWANEYFESRDLADNAFLYVYFAEMYEDDDVGFMCYVAGNRATTVMDSEAIDIFWNHVDGNWYSDMSTDALFAKVFNDTARSIMHVSTTGKDIVKTIILVFGTIIFVIVLGCIFVSFKRAKAAEAEATAKVLNTPLEDLKNQSKQQKDDLLDKYTDS